MIQHRGLRAATTGVALASLALPIGAAQSTTTPVIRVDNPPNTQAQQRKHYVVLVSFDGFRFDYPTKYAATHLLSLGKGGASTPRGCCPAIHR